MNADETAALIAEARGLPYYDSGSLADAILGRTTPKPIHLRLADALESATNKDSLTVCTVEELDALPVETVMLDRDFDAWKVTCEEVDGTEIRYQCTDGSHYYTAKALLRHGPFRIVWIPVVS